MRILISRKIFIPFRQLLGKNKPSGFPGSLHVPSAIFVILAGITGGFGDGIGPAVLIFAGMLVYQHTLVKPNDLSRVNLAFMTANGIASVVFALFVIADMFITHKH